MHDKRILLIVDNFLAQIKNIKGQKKKQKTAATLHQ